MPDMNAAIGRLRGAAKTALTRSRKVAGGQMDEDLMIFERLKPEQLKGLEQVYGQEAVIQYVKTMAAKKVKQNGS